MKPTLQELQNAAAEAQQAVCEAEAAEREATKKREAEERADCTRQEQKVADERRNTKLRYKLGEPQEPVEGLYVATDVRKFYDYSNRSWCVYMIDKFGNQCGNAFYVATKKEVPGVVKTFKEEIRDAQK